MKKVIVLTVVFLCISVLSYAFSISCNYETGEEVCNGYRLKNECKDEYVSVMDILSLRMWQSGLNDEAFKELVETRGCLTTVKNDNSKARGFVPQPKEILLTSCSSSCYVDAGTLPRDLEGCYNSCLKDEEVEPADFGIKEDGNREIRANCLLMCGGEIK